MKILYIYKKNIVYKYYKKNWNNPILINNY